MVPPIPGSGDEDACAGRVARHREAAAWKPSYPLPFLDCIPTSELREAMHTGQAMTVLCVDDNPHVAEALRVKLARSLDILWQGWLSSADELVHTAERLNPTIVLLDVDMPGKDPFVAVSELADRCPTAKVVIFSGHVRRELIDRALESGAWGYVSKNDDEGDLLKVIRAVADGEVAFSPEVRSTYDRM